MKQWFHVGTVVCGLLITQFAYSLDNSAYQQNPDVNQRQARLSDVRSNESTAESNNRTHQGRYGTYDNMQRSGNQNEGYQYQYGSPASGEQCVYRPAPQDQALGDCYCLYVHYEPCYYTTKRCVEEQIPCKKTCCRYVDKYYERQKCRMVPEYYNETFCKKEPEYYEVDDSKCCKKTVYDQHCEYVPKYYWKHLSESPCQ